MTRERERKAQTELRKPQAVSRCVKTLRLQVGIKPLTHVYGQKYAILKSRHPCFNGNNLINVTNIYSQACIKRSPLGQIKKGIIKQVTS